MIKFLIVAILTVNLTIVSAIAQQIPTSSFEGTLRAFQERLTQSKPDWLTDSTRRANWPTAGDGTPAPLFPQDGFYSAHAGTTGVEIQFQQAVSEMVGELSGLLNGYLTDPQSIEGEFWTASHSRIYDHVGGSDFYNALLQLDAVGRYARIQSLLTKLKYCLAFGDVQVSYAGLESLGQGGSASAAWGATLPMGPGPMRWETRAWLEDVNDEETLWTVGQWGFDISTSVVHPSLSGVPRLYLAFSSFQEAPLTPNVPADSNLHEVEAGRTIQVRGQPLRYDNFWYPPRNSILVGVTTVLQPAFQHAAAGAVPTKQCSGAKLNSVHYQWPIGRDKALGAESSIQLDTELPGTAWYAPEALMIPASGNFRSVRDAQGKLQQVHGKERVIQIVVQSASSYELHFYHRVSSWPVQGDGSVETSGSPYMVAKVFNPDLIGLTNNRLRIEQVEGGTLKWSEFSYNANERRWELASSESNFVESLTKSARDANGSWSEDRGKTNALGTVLAHTRTFYQAFAWGPEKIMEIEDPEGVARTTAWTYFDNRDVDGYQNYGQIKSVSYPDGRWERRSYDAVRRLVKTVEGYLDAGASSADEDSVVTTVVPSTSSNPYTTTTRSIQGKEVSRSYQRDYWDGYDLIQCVSPGASVSATGNLVTEVRTYLAGIFAGRVKSVKAPDGTVTLYEYQADAATLEEAEEVTTTTKVGVPNVGGTDIVAGTQTIVLSNRQGETLLTTTHDIESGLLTDRVITNQVDDFGRPLELEYLDGTKELFVYDCCKLSASVDRHGLQTTYGKAPGVVSSTRLGMEQKVVTEGRVSTTSRKDAMNVVTPLGEVEHNVAGEVIRSTVAGSGESLTARSYNITTRLTQTTATSPDGGTRIDVVYPGGQLKISSGTAAHPVRYEYGADTSGNTWVKAIALDGSLNDTLEWSRAWTDMAGRIWKEENPRGATTRTYNSKGQLSKVTDADGVANLFVYDDRGRQVQTVLDVNRNGVVDLAGSDRIVQVDREVVSRTGGRVVHREKVKSWAEDASDVATTLRTTDVAVDGLDTWIDTDGLVAHQHKSYSGSGAWTSQGTLADGSTVTDYYTNGRLASQVHRNSLNIEVDKELRRYDSAGRLWQVEDARGGITSFGYDSGDRVQSVTTPKGTTTFGYDVAGRKQSTTLQDGTVVSNSFFKTGAVKEVYGNGAYPVSYTYDSQGRVKTMTTGSGTTTWEYESDTGWLHKKSDHTGRGAVLGYTNAGRTYSATNARGVVKLYDYADSGDVEGYAYSDSITPAVVLGWNRQGELRSTFQAGELYQASFTPWGEVETETLSGGVRDGLALGRLRDSLHRVESLAAIRSEGSITSQVYGYDEASRLETVTSGTYSASIAYHPDASFIEELTTAVAGVSKTSSKRIYDAIGNLKTLTSKDVNGITKFSADYLYNSISQRTEAVREDGSVLKWEYNVRGEVAKQERSFANGVPAPHQTEEFEYDAIGNRTLLELKQGRSAAYDSNEVNQYGNRSVPPHLMVQGVADTDSRVVVQGKPARRKGREFWKDWEVDNSAGPVRENVRVAATKPHGGLDGSPLVSLETGRMFLPSSQEVFEYDEDGNLTRDDRWSYIWDAENRLVAMEERVVPKPPTWTRLRLEFSYDAFGRRTQRIVKNWDGSQWVSGERLVFLYDGWNLIAELKVSGASLLPFRSYVWGLDLNGSDQGLGGIGGLLFAKTEGASPVCHVPTLDGNGNIIGYLDAQSGNAVCQKEYDAFGRTAKSVKLAEGQSAEVAASLPFGFSSKYCDAETGLLYFGYRYYNADLGRWISQDPIGEAGGLNLYAFVGNDGVNVVDPLGLAAELVVAVPTLGETFVALGANARTAMGKGSGPTAVAALAAAAWYTAYEGARRAAANSAEVEAYQCNTAMCATAGSQLASIVRVANDAMTLLSSSIALNDSKEAKRAAQTLDQAGLVFTAISSLIHEICGPELRDLAATTNEVIRRGRQRAEELRLNQSGNASGGGGAANSGGELMRQVAQMQGTALEKANAIAAGAKRLNLTFTPVENVAGGWQVFVGKTAAGGRTAPLLAIHPTTGQLFKGQASALRTGSSGTSYLDSTFLTLIE